MAILDHIYESVADDEAFAALPPALSELLGSRSCSMLAYDHTRQITSFAANHFTSDMYAFQQNPEVAATDVWTGLGARPDRIGKVVNCADHWDTPTFKRTTYYNECIRSFGDDSVHAMGCVLRSADGYLAFAIHSGDVERPFATVQAGRLSRLMPHVFRMMDLRARLDSAKAGTDLLQGALDQCPEGVLALDAGLRVRIANSRGLAMLSSGVGLRLVAGRVATADVSQQERFSAAVRAAANWSFRRADAMLIDRSDLRPPYRLLVSPLAGQSRTALVIVEDPEDRDATLTTTLQNLFSLTASEASLAVLLVDGATPEEAAQRRNVRLSTVRTQIKSLLQKTDARRLPDLMRLIARVPRRPPRH